MDELGKYSMSRYGRIGIHRVNIWKGGGWEGVKRGLGGTDQSPNCWGRMVIRLLPSHQVGYYLRCMRP